MTSEPRFLGRGINYLSDIGARLADLQGLRTLIHELVQNADDASDARSMAFRLRPDALVVENDGVFTDCDQIEDDRCPWTDDGVHRHRCDFHRFREIASGDKRNEAGTTGAFGIGFISVYQVTDRPELISAGRHWTLHEDSEESRRIQQCAGCERCNAADLPGTRFILPWARDPHSPLRQALRADVVGEHIVSELRHELEASIPISMLFLKKVESVVVDGNGPRLTFRRSVEDTTTTLTWGRNQEHREVWHILAGQFDESGEQLRARHRGIEAKRSTKVSIALRADAEVRGLLCASLPTEQSHELPFHLNADFYPTNDRKSILLGDDYHGEWNRAALLAAADILPSSLSSLRELLGPRLLWALLASIRTARDHARGDRGERTFAAFWDRLAPQLKAQEVIPTISGGWCRAFEAVLLAAPEEARALPLLRELDLQVVNEDLRPYQNVVREIGVAALDVDRLCVALETAGMAVRCNPGDPGMPVRSLSDREMLWRLVGLLRSRQSHNPQASRREAARLGQIALAPGRDGALWPCEQVVRAGNRDVRLLERLGLAIPLLTSSAAFDPLADLCKELDARRVIEELEGTNATTELLTNDVGLLNALIEWFAGRRTEFAEDEELTVRLTRLPIFPGAKGLAPLTDLTLPGDFEDPLGLTDLLDVGAVRGHVDFLGSLGVKQLSLRTFLLRRLPDAVRQDALTAEQRTRATVLLAQRLGEVRGEPDAERLLRPLPLVPCRDGEFRPADECYFASQVVADCLGTAVNIAAPIAGEESSTRALFVWLGVAETPRLGDLLSRIRVLAGGPATAPSKEQVRKIVSHLGEAFPTGDPQLESLRNLAWLPARSALNSAAAIQWQRPVALHATFNEYLFASQGMFVDLPQPLQAGASKFLEFLGVELSAPLTLVVRHLQHLSDSGVAPHPEIYRVLNENHAHQLIAALRGSNCLWVGDRYRRPSEVCWAETDFGRYLARLDGSLREFEPLLSALGVKEKPNADDAIEVLRAISDEFGSRNAKLDPEASAALDACWRRLSVALDSGEISHSRLSALAQTKCVPDRDLTLVRPTWIFFESRPGLAEKFDGFVRKNLVSRTLATGTALAAAGVRPLASAVTVVLLEFANPNEAADVVRRVQERRLQIARILDSQGQAALAADALRRLDEIRFEVGDELQAQYRLNAFDRQVVSPPEALPALLTPNDGTLRFVMRDGAPPWSSVARELTGALFPEEETGRFAAVAAGLKDVLAARTTEEAVRELDELGFARLDDTPIVQPTAPTVLTHLGEAGDPFGGEQPETVGDTGGTSIADEPEQTSDEERPAPRSQESSNEQADRDGSPLPDRDDRGDRGDRPGHRTPNGGRRNENRHGAVLRSYVIPNRDPNDESSDGDHNERNLTVDRAGMDRVLEFEAAAGRWPQEMPHDNEGYDIESYDEAGNLVRYIEVKSSSGPWDLTSVGLSRPQFKKGEDEGERFWLYVVERALSEDFVVYPIRDPARRATHFMFDDGWRAVAESGESSEQQDAGQF